MVLEGGSSRGPEALLAGTQVCRVPATGGSSVSPARLAGAWERRAHKAVRELGQQRTAQTQLQRRGPCPAPGPPSPHLEPDTPSCVKLVPIHFCREHQASPTARGAGRDRMPRSHERGGLHPPCLPSRSIRISFTPGRLEPCSRQLVMAASRWLAQTGISLLHIGAVGAVCAEQGTLCKQPCTVLTAAPVLWPKALSLGISANLSNVKELPRNSSPLQPWAEMQWVGLAPRVAERTFLAAAERDADDPGSGRARESMS